jgi:hypothetical protein
VKIRFRPIKSPKCPMIIPLKGRTKYHMRRRQLATAGFAPAKSKSRSPARQLLDACEHYLSYERGFAQTTIAGCTTVTGQFLLTTFANGPAILTGLDAGLVSLLSSVKRAIMVGQARSTPPRRCGPSFGSYCIVDTSQSRIFPPANRHRGIKPGNLQ